MFRRKYKSLVSFITNSFIFRNQQTTIIHYLINLHIGDSNCISIHLATVYPGIYYLISGADAIIILLNLNGRVIFSRYITIIEYSNT